MLTVEMFELYALLPDWVDRSNALEPLPPDTEDLCICGNQATYVVLGPDYPYCSTCLGDEDSDAYVEVSAQEPTE